MTGTGNVSRRIGRVGVAGLTASFVAAFIHETPGATEFLMWFVNKLITVLFQLAVVLSFVIGLAVILYSHRKQQEHGVSERVHRITGAGVCSVLGLSLLFPVVILDDILRVLGPMIDGIGPGIPPGMYFYGSITLFGTMAFIRVLDIVTQRFRATHA